MYTAVVKCSIFYVSIMYNKLFDHVGVFLDLLVNMYCCLYHSVVFIQKLYINFFFVISLYCKFLICNWYRIYCLPVREGVDKMLQMHAYICGVNGVIVNVWQIAQHHCYRIMGLLESSKR